MSRVRRRLVLYLSGFDPRGVRWYHQLYRAEAAKQAALGGYTLSVGKRERVDEHLHRWQLHYEDDQGAVETEYLFCEWDDIVRHFWVKHPLKLASVTLSASLHALRNGIFQNTFRWSWPAGVTATMPALLLLALMLATLGFAGAGYALFGWLGAAIGLLAGFALLWLAYRLEQKFNLTWVGRILGFHEAEDKSGTEMLEKRRVLFADLLRARLAQGDVDEILVAGHSYGAALAISVVARALDALGDDRPPLSLLTLGQTIMWLAWLPQAEKTRAEIAAAANDARIDWVDISAPPDGACFALVDPYTAIGDRQTDRKNPKLLNAKFHEIIAEADYARGSRDWMRLHFQYIMAGAKAGEYDFFAITAGPKTLGERFAARPSVRDFTRLRRGSTKALR